MIAVFTQTYGDDRRELYQIREKDNLLNYFVSSFDMNIYSFHNCSSQTIDFFKSINKMNNTKYYELNNLSYTDSLKFIIDELKKFNCTKLIFLQDDVFTFNQSKEELDVIINYIKFGKSPLINLEMNVSDFKSDIKNNKNPIFNENGVEIYKFFTKDFSENGRYSFDDAPFSIDFDLINVIFDDQFFTMGDVWRGEMYNNEKFKIINFPRYCTNKIFLKRYNIVGRNNWNRSAEFIDLNKNFLIK